MSGCVRTVFVAAKEAARGGSVLAAVGCSTTHPAAALHGPGRGAPQTQEGETESKEWDTRRGAHR